MKLIWITGLSGSGKTTIAKEVYKSIKKQNMACVLIDGDTMREINANDLGYSKEDRLKNAKRIANLCKFLVESEIIVVCATVSLFKEIHELNRQNIQNYYEVFIQCDLEELKKRDQKGLYSSNNKNLVGISQNYDIPKKPHLLIENSKQDALNEKVKQVLKLACE